MCNQKNPILAENSIPTSMHNVFPVNSLRFQLFDCIFPAWTGELVSALTSYMVWK